MVHILVLSSGKSWQAAEGMAFGEDLSPMMVVPGRTVVNGVVDAALLDAEYKAALRRRGAVAPAPH